MIKAFLSRSIGLAVGSLPVTNTDLNRRFPEWSADQIQAKIGVRTRAHVGEREDSLDLAKKACMDFFRKSQFNKNMVDYIILVTSSPRYVTPSSSVLLQDLLGLSTGIGAVDVNQGCSGYVYGLSLAKGLVSSGQAQNVLLVTAETYSKYIDKEDKSNLTIFGDAATCSLVSRNSEDSWEIGEFHFGSQGSDFDKIMVEDGIFTMDGKAVFNFTAKTVVSELKSFVNVSEYDGSFVFHQANAFMLDYMRKKLKISNEKFIVHMSNYGNTVSNSIPIALTVTSDRNVVLAGFGVGLSWSFVKLF